MNKSDFLNPRDCKALDQAQTPFWFWNDKLEDEEILRQLKLMTEAGITCSAPHARSGYVGDYMTEEWFRRIQTVLDYKKAHDEPVWIYDEFNWPAGSCNGAVSRDEQLLLTGLLEQNIDFTVFPSDATRLFKAVDGKLVNQRTGAEYKAFVLPMAEVLPVETARMLDAFARQGGYLCLMDCMPVYGMRKEDGAEVKSIFEALRSEGKLHFVSDAADAGTLGAWLNTVVPSPLTIVEGMSTCPNNHRCYPEWIVDPVMHNDEDLSGVAYIRYRKGDTREYFFVNFTGEPQQLTVRVPSTALPEVWETFTGEITPAKQLSVSDGLYEVQLTLQPNVGTVLMTWL